MDKLQEAGTSVRILGREDKYVLLTLSSGEVRKVLGECRATIGEVGNESHELITIGNAGRKRHMGIRPTVRGSAMNPVITLMVVEKQKHQSVKLHQ